MRAVAVAMVALFALTACTSGGDETSYTATDMATGEEASVDALRGQPALLVSWTTWCTECEEELAGLAAFAESADAEGIEIVAVNLDASDVEDEIDAKVAAAGLTTALWRDRRNEFRRAFGAIGVPTTVLLDADGQVAGTFAGAVDFEDEEVRRAIDALRDP